MKNYKQLTKEQRFYIEKRLTENVTKSQIARELGVSYTTIGREITRNSDPIFKGLYSHLRANTIYANRRHLTNIGYTLNSGHKML